PPGDTRVHAIFAEFGLDGCTWPTKERAALGNGVLQSVRIADVQFELIGESITNPGGDVMLNNRRETNDPECFIKIIRELHALNIAHTGAPTIVGLDGVTAVVIAGP